MHGEVVLGSQPGGYYATTSGDHGGGCDISQLKVLVAEDDELCKKYFLKILRQLGVTQVLAVDNGLEAMRAVRRENFTHVFLDLVLPCIDGEAGLRRAA